MAGKFERLMCSEVGMGNKKAELYCIFFVQDISTGTLGTRQIGTFGEMCLLVGHYVLVYDREYMSRQASRW